MPVPGLDHMVWVRFRGGSWDPGFWTPLFCPAGGEAESGQSHVVCFEHIQRGWAQEPGLFDPVDCDWAEQ
ncbi:hypothetical protein Hesp01_63970 [Herbidospora sp. NBRC 101105]|nr:hypothetical protein Hesp01_63970 [Herbidospora sp. NBRC 101105]